MTVWIHVDTSKDVGDNDHLKVFASEAAGRDLAYRACFRGLRPAYPVYYENTRRGHH